MITPTLNLTKFSPLEFFDSNFRRFCEEARVPGGTRVQQFPGEGPALVGRNSYRGLLVTKHELSLRFLLWGILALRESLPQPILGRHFFTKPDVVHKISISEYTKTTTAPELSS